MQSQKLDIVELIELNPITKLSNTYKNKFVEKVKQHFTEAQQNLFVSSFYCYLNYNTKTDYVIDLDNVWKWLGFGRKEECKRVLTRHFTIDIDFKIYSKKMLLKTAPPVGGVGIIINETDIKNTKSKNLGGSGLNKEHILMNIITFKKLCLKSCTQKADEVHDYFLKLEELLQEIINEESNDLKNQLLQKEQLLIQHKEKTEIEKEELLEKTLLSQFPVNTQCVYIGKIDDKDGENGNLIKFGNSNDLNERVKTHKKTYTNFRLVAVFKVKNQIEIENCIKRHPILKLKIRYIMINGINYRELLNIDVDNKNPDFSLDKLYEYIKEIIDQNEYNIENYNKLSVKCNELEIKNKILENENIKLKKEIEELNKFKPITSIEEKQSTNSRTETSIGYSLYAFQTNIINRYKIGLCKLTSLSTKESILKNCDTNGEMKLMTKIKHPFLEKTLLFLCKKHLVMLNNDTFDSSIENIKLIFSIILEIEKMLINDDLENIQKILEGKKIQIWGDGSVKRDYIYITD